MDYYDEQDFNDKEIEILNKLDDDLLNYIKEQYLNDFMAYYLYSYNKCEIKVLTGSLFQQVNTAIETFAQLTYEDVDIDKVKSILKEKYNLKIKNEEKIELEEI